jgi:alpha-mannosidase
MPATPLTAHVVSHTHWDREWYRTFEVFRFRLVDQGDAVLDLLESDPAYGPFYWDGQTCVIDDYLEIRPEMADRLRKACTDGRLVTGPWFVQPDEFLVSGESFVRNLLLGRRMCREWGAGQQVGYAPDAFGHTSQMPQILCGFGIDNAVFFRGITADQVASEFLWRSPDGSEVLAVKMPDNTAYSNFYYRFRETLADTDRGIALDPERVVAEATQLLEESLAERPTTPYILWMDGVDHVLPQPRTPEIIRIVNERLGDRVQAKTATLREHVDAVLAAAPDLATHTGEMRIANRAWNLQALLAHVASSRIHTKQLNHQCETLLERWAEPWTTFAWLLEKQHGPVAGGERRPEYWQRPPVGLLRHAWKQLLLNQPHDSICGCSVDQVHRDMINRYERCLQVGEKLTTEALERIAARVDTTPPVSDDPHAPEALDALVVTNPLGWDRAAEPVDVVVRIPGDSQAESIRIVGPEGEACARITPMGHAHTMSQAPHDIPVAFGWKRFNVRFLAQAPAFGYSTYHVVANPGSVRVAPSEGAVRVADGALQNEYLRVEVAEDGSISLTDLATGRTTSGGLVFEDGGDFGDGYNYVAPPKDMVMTTAGSLLGDGLTILTERDEIEGRLIIRRQWFVPADRDGDTRNDVVQAPIDIRAVVALRRGARRADVTIDVVNAAKDHRLRVLFPSGATEATHVDVEQAYDVVARTIVQPDTTDWREKQPATGPQKTFTDVSDASGGLCVINKGLPEVEVKDDAQRTIAVSLLRATANGVGAPDEQHEGQMQGAYRFELALLPHAGDWQEARVWQAAHGFSAPLRATQTGLHAGPLAASASLLAVSPDTMAATAVKVTEDEQALLVRVLNLGDEPAEAAIAGPLLTGRATVGNLAEEPGSPLVINDGAVTVTARRRGLVTVLVEA